MCPRKSYQLPGWQGSPGEPGSFCSWRSQWGSCSHAGGKLQTIRCWNLNQLFFRYPCVLLMITSKYRTCFCDSWSLSVLFFFYASMNYVTGWRGKGSWAPLFSSFAEKNVNKNGMGSIYFWTHVHSLSSQELDEKTNQYHSLDCAELSQEGS